MSKKKEKYYTAPEAMEMTGLSKPRLYHYLKSGRFKTAKKLHGTRWVIGESDVKAFLSGEIDLSGVYSKKEKE